MDQFLAGWRGVGVTWIIPSILRQLSSLLLENSPVDRHEPLFKAGSSNIQPTLIRLWRDLVSIEQSENAFLEFPMILDP
jgi:hypothetical protein